MIRAFLVDDEALAVRRLARLLEATGRVELAGSATDPAVAVEQIGAARDLDVAFLDISMPGLDGFGVRARLPPGVVVVFTTAHDEHALRAFEANAIDYLLKPVDAAALARALDKVERLRAVPGPLRIASRLGDRTHLVELARITHFLAEDKLTYAVAGDKSYVVEPPIAELEARYASAGFFRIHRSTLVALAAVVEVHAAADGLKVRLADGTELAVARERGRSLKDRLGLS